MNMGRGGYQGGPKPSGAPPKPPAFNEKPNYCNQCGLPHKPGRCGRRKCKRCGKEGCEFPPDSHTGRERPYCITCTNYIEWATS